MPEQPMSADVRCSATADASVGSTCTLATTVDALVPNAVREGDRAIWELGPVEVYDGGPAAVGATADNAVFARQGVFVP